MNKGQEGIVLFGFVYIDDGQYGDRHRVILTKEPNEGFRTKTEAKKYTARLKKHVQERFGRSVDYKFTNKDISCADHSTLKTYEYHSMGPSLSHTHHYITPKDLD